VLATVCRLVYAVNYGGCTFAGGTPSNVCVSEPYMNARRPSAGAACAGDGDSGSGAWQQADVRTVHASAAASVRTAQRAHAYETID
jgi:hypothetical protein